jgi:hypothetical protein
MSLAFPDNHISLISLIIIVIQATINPDWDSQLLDDQSVHSDNNFWIDLSFALRLYPCLCLIWMSAD